MKSSNVIFHPTNIEELNALKAIGKALRLKFEITSDESMYKPEFVEKILKSKKQYQAGDFTTVKKEDLNKLLGL